MEVLISGYTLSEQVQLSINRAGYLMYLKAQVASDMTK